MRQIILVETDADWPPAYEIDEMAKVAQFVYMLAVAVVLLMFHMWFYAAPGLLDFFLVIMGGLSWYAIGRTLWQEYQINRAVKRMTDEH